MITLLFHVTVYDNIKRCKISVNITGWKYLEPTSMKSTYSPGNTRTCGEKRRGPFASRGMAEYPPQCAASHCGARVRRFDCIRSVSMGARRKNLRLDARYQNSGSQNLLQFSSCCVLPNRILVLGRKTQEFIFFIHHRRMVKQTSD